VITSETIPGAPQYTLQFSDWNAAPQVEADRFEFAPPPGARQLDPSAVAASAIGDMVMRCAGCGGGFSKISATHFGCSTARNKGPTACTNRLTVQRDVREAQVLIEAWRRHHSRVRPHSALGYRPPAPETVPTARSQISSGAGPAAMPHQNSTRTTRWGRVTASHAHAPGSRLTCRQRTSSCLRRKRMIFPEPVRGISSVTWTDCGTL